MAQASGARAAALAADLALTTLYATPTPVFDAVAGRALCERTIALARDLDDRAAESKALWNLMTLNVFSGGEPRKPSTPASAPSRSRASWTPESRSPSP